MEKTAICFIRLYPDNPEDALIIAGLGTRKRKGEKSRVIKDILYAHFRNKKSSLPEPPTESRKGIKGPSSQLHPKSTALSDDEKVTLKKNLDELSDMLM